MEDLKWKVRKVFEACTALKLKLNLDKTEVLLLSTKKKTIQHWQKQRGETEEKPDNSWSDSR